MVQFDRYRNISKSLDDRFNLKMAIFNVDMINIENARFLIYKYETGEVIKDIQFYKKQDNFVFFKIGSDIPVGVFNFKIVLESKSCAVTVVDNKVFEVSYIKKLL